MDDRVYRSQARRKIQLDEKRSAPRGAFVRRSSCTDDARQRDEQSHGQTRYGVARGKLQMHPRRQRVIPPCD